MENTQHTQAEQVTEQAGHEEKLFDVEKRVLKFFEDLDAKAGFPLALYLALYKVNGKLCGSWPLLDAIWAKFDDLDCDPCTDDPETNWLKGVFDALQMLNDRG